jgi:hypothetical protein
MLCLAALGADKPLSVTVRQAFFIAGGMSLTGKRERLILSQMGIPVPQGLIA